MTGADALPGGGAARPAGGREGPYAMGLLIVIATVTMLFAGFTAALLVRRTAPDWAPIGLPGIVWINTLVIAASSGAVELARSGCREGSRTRLVRGLAGALLLGALFLAGQVVAWRHLAAENVLLSTGPHAAFFYVLSAVHGAHVLGGLGALAWTLRRARRGAYGPQQRAGLDHAAVFWHFIGGLWLYLLTVLAAL